MGEKSRAFDALCEAIRADAGVSDAQEQYDRVVREYALNDIGSEYDVIHNALDGVPESIKTSTAARLILRWCEDVNTRVLTGER